jgi:hypothetical protein
MECILNEPFCEDFLEYFKESFYLSLPTSVYLQVVLRDLTLGWGR